MKRVITVKQQERIVFNQAIGKEELQTQYKIIKLHNSVSWTIGGWFSRDEIQEIIENKIAEVIVT